MAKKDAELEEESVETPADSPTEEETPSKETESAEEKETAETEEETTWKELSGSTQRRIVELLKRAKDAEKKAELAEVRARSYPPPATTDKPEPSSDEILEAVKKLKGYGVVTKDDLDALQGRLWLDREHGRLETKHDGSDGLPKYSREEVEDYARTHYFGTNLEAAYNEMYWDERIDAETGKRAKKTTPYTEKPTASVKIGEKPLTRETLRERLREKDGADWWAKNREKIEPLLKTLSRG